MAEYIEREAAIKAVSENDCEGYATQAVKSIRAADVRPVARGKWKLGGYGQISDAKEKWYDQFLTGGFLYCSICKARTSVKFNFCPNCGAMMEEN